MRLEKKPEVVILGGGVIGFSIAYHLQKEGVSCVVIEMDSIASRASGVGWGCCASPAGRFIIYASRGTPIDQVFTLSHIEQPYPLLKQLQLLPTMLLMSFC